LALANGGGGGILDTVNVASYFTNVTRMPVDRCSVTWFPAQGDEDWIPPMSLNAAQTGAVEKIFASTHFTAVFVTGAGANNVRFSATQVIEAQDLGALASGSAGALPWAVAIKSGPSVPWKEVIKGLAAKDPAWYLDTFRKAAMFGVGLVDSAISGGLPGALGYLTRSATKLAFGGRRGKNAASGV